MANLSEVSVIGLRQAFAAVDLHDAQTTTPNSTLLSRYQAALVGGIAVSMNFQKFMCKMS